MCLAGRVGTRFGTPLCAHQVKCPDHAPSYPPTRVHTPSCAHPCMCSIPPTHPGYPRTRTNMQARTQEHAYVCTHALPHRLHFRGPAPSRHTVCECRGGDHRPQRRYRGQRLYRHGFFVGLAYRDRREHSGVLMWPMPTYFSVFHLSVLVSFSVSRSFPLFLSLRLFIVLKCAERTDPNAGTGGIGSTDTDSLSDSLTETAGNIQVRSFGPYPPTCRGFF